MGRRASPCPRTGSRSRTGSRCRSFLLQVDAACLAVVGVGSRVGVAAGDGRVDAVADRVGDEVAAVVVADDDVAGEERFAHLGDDAVPDPVAGPAVPVAFVLGILVVGLGGDAGDDSGGWSDQVDVVLLPVLEVDAVVQFGGVGGGHGGSYRVVGLRGRSMPPSAGFQPFWWGMAGFELAGRFTSVMRLQAMP
ncbi:MAG: hypothetical protein DRQ42_08020 [Gammaproteobacteria bacterium]|nr:MAG: hypothetical protein DRQ42_08020 [Gammaproteobacteria bacterium]